MGKESNDIGWQKWVGQWCKNLNPFWRGFCGFPSTGALQLHLRLKILHASLVLKIECFYFPFCPVQYHNLKQWKIEIHISLHCLNQLKGQDWVNADINKLTNINISVNTKGGLTNIRIVCIYNNLHVKKPKSDDLNILNSI